jgi:flagellar biosynthesis protein FliR
MDVDLTKIAQLVEINDLIVFLLVLFRIAGIFLVAPILGSRSIPPMFQIAFAVILSLLIFPQIQFSDALALQSDLHLLQLILREVSVGVILGFTAMLIFTAIQVAGEIVGMKVGFSIAAVIDPNTQGMTSVLSQFYFLIGALLFLYLDGHHIMIEALVRSFEIMPIGTPLSTAFAGSLPGLLTQLLALAIKLAAPVIIVITLVNLIFGLLTKLSPQMNIYFNVGFIVGPILGILAIMASLPLMKVLVTQMTESMRPEMFQIIQEMRGI